MSLVGHLWTVGSRLRRSPAEPPARDWSLRVEDPALGPVRLSGRLSAAPGARGAVLLVHGISGSADSRYARRTAAAAVAAGLSCLRLNLRGADRRGEDYYHAGLSEDLAAALASPELAGYRELYALGFSLGGHLVLRLATAPGDPRLAAVAAVCSPLDLAAGQRAIDRPANTLYRAYVLRGLKEMYAAVAARRAVPVPVAVAAGLRTLRAWDDAVVAPRHGFADAGDYYARASVAPRLGELRVPALLVAARHDPMVPAGTLRPVLDRHAGSRLTVRWVAGGHLGFPARSGLGPLPAAAGGGAPARLEAQLLAWLAVHGGGDDPGRAR